MSRTPTPKAILEVINALIGDWVSESTSSCIWISDLNDFGAIRHRPSSGTSVTPPSAPSFASTSPPPPVSSWSAAAMPVEEAATNIACASSSGSTLGAGRPDSEVHTCYVNKVLKLNLVCSWVLDTL
ncbi:hypothetical protein RHGRI_000460 [Rhododendron griersonianum]|uniref:Uncharacterized protein n=1 Tax=Rhododendron griersonianum TaxID=479676 RepID=A0AAV6LGP0_9ERIC|nr:hypothetical protein RHGRI_000460 [Rhododendron griersonianum]